LCAISFALAITHTPSTAAAIVAPLPGNPTRGAALYQSRCSACHSLDANRVGPSHRGVVGRRAGAVSNYSYSASLVRSRIIWTQVNLDRWLTNPVAMVPGTQMGIRVPSAQERADIIAYLRNPPPQ
jgi:cytochrome c